jgi:RimK family alpha-L-glutamate ligase
MKVIVFSSRASNTEEGENSGLMRTAKRIKEESKKLGVSCHVFFKEDLNYEKKNNKHFVKSEDKAEEISVDDTIIIVRGATKEDSSALSILSSLEDEGFFIVNTKECVEICEDKYRTHLRLSQEKIPSPKTVALPKPIFDEEDDPRKIENIKNYTVQVGSKYPMILKTSTGSKGSGVMIIESENSLVSVVQTIHKVDREANLLLQEYIPYKKDMRVIVLGNEVVAAMERKSVDGDFRSNYSLGGKAKSVNIDDNQKQLAIDAASAVEGVFVGVDILESNGRNYVIEVNASPGTEGIETATKKNVTKEFLEYCLNKTNWTNKETNNVKLDGESIDEMYENYVYDTSSMYFNKSLLVRKVENSRVNESKKIDRLLKLEKQGDLFARLCIEEAKNRQRKEESEKWLNKTFEENFKQKENTSKVNTKRDKYIQAFGENWQKVYYAEAWRKYNEEYDESDLEGTDASVIKRKSQTPGEPLYDLVRKRNV